MAKKVIKKAAPATAAVETKKYSNITNVEDFATMVKDQYNATNTDKVSKETVAKVMKAFSESLESFASTMDADKAQCILPGIGRLTVKVQAAREGINPKTKEKITVPAKKRISFKAFPKFTDSINA